MKILIVSNMYPSSRFPAYGIFVKNFIDICEENNLNVDKIVLYKNTSILSKMFHYLIYYFKIFFSVLFKNYDLVYVHYAGQNSLPFYFLTKIKKINLIFNLHGSDVFAEKRIHKYFLNLTKKVVKKCTIVVVPSEYYKDVVSNEFNLIQDKIYIFPSSGINETIFYPKEKKLARQNVGLDLSDRKKIIGFVGRIEYGKGWDVLLDSIRILNDKGVINSIDYQFIFIGDGKESVKFDEKVKELSIGIYITRIASIPQKLLCDYYNSFDLFCFPSKRKSESLGLVGIEALACGVPVISSDFAAPKYYIKNGYNGYKFEVDSAEDLANSIAMYLNLQEKEKQTMSMNCINSSLPYRKKIISVKLINKILKS